MATATSKPKQNASPLYRPQSAFDLLSIPIIGSALKSRYGRLLLQIPLLIITIALLYDGFTGPQNAAENLATVLPWVHYRGLIVLALLLLGNVFCMGCPFTIPRTLAKKLSISGARFPQFLRNKWLAIIALFAIFFIYEYLDLWASPTLTAWLIVAYFVASFALEAFFKESVFCKYVCPLGSFNFVYASSAPTQIAIKDHAVCQSCQGKECVNGSYTTESIIRIDKIPFIDADGNLHYKDVQVEHNPQGTLGCGTELFPPQIKGNMDCVLCLDCVRACPHDNIGWMARTPGRELLKSGTWAKRWDMSLFVIMLSFFAVVNAFGMVPPVFDLLEWFATIGFTDEFVPLFLIFFVGAILAPIVFALGAAKISQIITNTAEQLSLRDTVATFAPAFIPLGLGIWIAHYVFHFLIAPLSFVPILQEFFGATRGDWATYGFVVDQNIIGAIQLIALLGGFLWSMVIALRSADRAYGKRASFGGMMPWAIVLLLLMLAAYQVFALPMEMRGTDAIFASLNWLVF
ncbi:MAG: FesM [Chloroflexota bacterium]